MSVKVKDLAIWPEDRPVDGFKRDAEFCPHTGDRKTFRQGKDQCLDCGTIIYDTYANYCEG